MNANIKIAAVALVTILTSWQALSQAATRAYSETAYSRALAIRPDDPVARARRAVETLPEASSGSIGSEKPKSDALVALRGDPLTASAIGVLATVADLKKQERLAQRLGDLALSASRRETVSHILGIERNVRNNNIDEILKHYDIVFRTTQSADDVLFPILSRALSDAQIRKSFLRYVRNDNSWLGRFAGYSTADTNLATAWSEILVRKRGLPASPGFRDLERQVLFKLSTLGLYNEMKVTYLALPGARAQAFESISLPDGEGKPGVADWQLTDSPQVSATVSSDGTNDDPKLKVVVASSTQVAAARKLLILPPGQIRLSGDLQAETGVADLYVTCAGQSGSTFRLAAIQLGRKNGPFALQATIPKVGCDAQYVDVFMGSTKDGKSGHLQLSSLALVTGG